MLEDWISELGKMHIHFPRPGEYPILVEAEIAAKDDAKPYLAKIAAI